jgi:Alpha-kinase family
LHPPLVEKQWYCFENKKEKMNPPPPKFGQQLYTAADRAGTAAAAAAATASSIQVVGYYNPSSTLDFQRRAREKGVIDLTTTATATGTTGRAAAAAAAGVALRNRPKQRNKPEQDAELSLPGGGKRTKTLETTNKASYAVTLETQWSQGTFRWVHKGKYTQDPRIPGGDTSGGTQTGQLCVIKEFKTGSVYEESFFKDDIFAVEKAAEIIHAFNRECRFGAAAPLGNNKKKTVHLNRPDVWQEIYPDATGKFKKKLVEPMLEGTFIKFNSNSGYANPGTDYMQALSHFSYHYSNRLYLLCDLQGGHYDDSYILTDPVIMSSDNSKQFGAGDLGSEGIDNFFAHHTCNNAYCNNNGNKLWCQPVQPRVSSRIPHTANTSFSLTLGTVKSEAERKQALARVLERSGMERY